MGKLDGKVALITGAGQGVGQGVAFALAKEGASVAVAGRTESKLVVTCNEIAERGGRAEPVLMDIADADSITGAVARTVELFGGVDILINNASLNPLGNVLDLTPERLADGLTSGPVATLRTMQACYPFMKERGGGAIINMVSSVAVRWDAAGYGGLRGREGIRPSPQSRGSMRMGRRRDPGQRGCSPRVVAGAAAVGRCTPGRGCRLCCRDSATEDRRLRNGHRNRGGFPGRPGCRVSDWSNNSARRRSVALGLRAGVVEGKHRRLGFGDRAAENETDQNGCQNQRGQNNEPDHPPHGFQYARTDLRRTRATAVGKAAAASKSAEHQSNSVLPVS